MNRPLPLVSLRWALLLAVLLGGAAAAEAQLVTASPGVSVYRYAEPGQPTMDVRVWGAVRTPGVYQVERDTDLVELLTLAGGPLYDREIPNVERTVTVRLSRGGSGRQVVFEAPLSALFAEAAVPPALQPDDVISVDVEVRQRFGWRDTLAIVSGVGTVAVVVLNILNLTR